MFARFLRPLSVVALLSTAVAQGCMHTPRHTIDVEHVRLEPVRPGVWRHPYLGPDGLERDTLVVVGESGSLVVDPPTDPDVVRRLVEGVTRRLDAPVVGVVLTNAPADPRGLLGFARGSTIYVDGGRSCLSVPGRRVLPLERIGRDLAGIRFQAQDLADGVAIWLPDRGVLFGDGRLLTLAAGDDAPVRGPRRLPTVR